MKFSFIGNLDGLMTGLDILADELSVEIADGGYEIKVTRVDTPAVSLCFKDNKGEIVYSEQCQFNRAFGLLVEALRDGKKEFSVEEKPAFNMNGPMFDMSQGNAAFNIKTMKAILRKIALMGLNIAMLYCEDNYEVPGRPYFGYMRPTYTQAEMRELDDYAYSLGIEMIPCIQTLAHMPDGLRWACFDDIRDYDACLLVGKEETYDFIRDLLTAASAPFRTKRIHIGMDEAWSLGRGKYIDTYGYRSPHEIMKEHLARVVDIVRGMGLEPMMWSDMFFRSTGNGKYYLLGRKVTDEMKAMVPKGIRCVYWDYYHLEEAQYEDLLSQHMALDENMIFAGGCWSWRGYGLTWEKTLRTTVAALSACRKMGVRDVFMTTWGDNGTESLATVNLIGCQLFAELGYAASYDKEKFARRFKFCTGGELSDFENIEYLDRTPFVMKENANDPYYYNSSKLMMWQDVLTGLFDKNYEGCDHDAHYAELTEKLREAAGRNGMFDGMFEFLALTAHTLAKKSEMGLRLTAAYRSGDREALVRFAEEELPELFRRVSELRISHMENWMEIYKPFGWDVMDMRYGSLLARIDSAIRQVKAYLEGKIERIEELEAERLYYGKEGPCKNNNYGAFVSPSRIDPRA